MKYKAKINLFGAQTLVDTLMLVWHLNVIKINSTHYNTSKTILVKDQHFCVHQPLRASSKHAFSVIFVLKTSKHIRKTLL